MKIIDRENYGPDWPIYVGLIAVFLLIVLVADSAKAEDPGCWDWSEGAPKNICTCEYIPELPECGEGCHP